MAKVKKNKRKQALNFFHMFNGKPSQLAQNHSNVKISERLSTVYVSGDWEVVILKCSLNCVLGAFHRKFYPSYLSHKTRDIFHMGGGPIP